LLKNGSSAKRGHIPQLLYKISVMHLNAQSEQIDLADAQDVSEVPNATHTRPV